MIRSAWLWLIVVCFGCGLRPTLDPLEPLMATPNDEFRRAPPAPKPREAEVPAVVERHLLDNGLTVFVVEKPSASFTAVVLVSRRAGSDEPPATAGYAAMLASALVKPLDALGASEEVVPDATLLSVVVFPHELERALGELSAPLLRGSLDPATVQRIAALRAAVLHDDAYLVTAQQQARRWVLGDGRGLALDTDGLIANAKRFDQRQATEALRSMFVPADTAIAVVGPNGGGEVLAAVKRHFGTWQGIPGEAAATPSHAIPTSPAAVHYRHAATAQAVVTLAFPAPPRTAEDHAATRVMVMIYGGLFMSRLNASLREADAHTYGAHAHYWAGRRDGLIITSSAIRNEQVLAALARLRDITASMRLDPATPVELEAAKATLIEKMRRGRETTGGLAASIAELFIYDLPFDEWQRAERAIAAVDADAVRAAVARYLARPAPIVVAGDSSVRALLARSSFDVVYGPDARR